MYSHKAFTFLELMIVVLIAAILAVGALPTGNARMSQEAELAAEQFEADVSFARSRSIARPDEPVLIKLDKDANSYWLAPVAQEDTAIPHPLDGEPYVVTFGNGGMPGTDNVDIVAADFGGDDKLLFDTFGGIDQSTPAILQLDAHGARCEVRVNPASASTRMSDQYSVNLAGTGSVGP